MASRGPRTQAVICAGSTCTWPCAFRAFTAIAVKARNARGQVQVLPAEITAWVRGPREAMTSDGGMFDATVDVEGLEPGQFQLPISIVAPARVGVVRLEPAEVKVRVR